MLAVKWWLWNVRMMHFVSRACKRGNRNFRASCENLLKCITADPNLFFISISLIWRLSCCSNSNDAIFYFFWMCFYHFEHFLLTTIWLCLSSFFLGNFKTWMKQWTSSHGYKNYIHTKKLWYWPFLSTFTYHIHKKWFL